MKFCFVCVAELYKPNYLKLMNRATSYYSKALNFSRPGTTTATLATDPVLWGFVNTKDDGAPIVTLNSVSAASKTPVPMVVHVAVQPPVPAPPAVTPGGTFTKPPIRTYSRKRKGGGAQVTTPRPSTLKQSTVAPSPGVVPKLPGVPLLPPSYESLIGFRGTCVHSHHVCGA